MEKISSEIKRYPFRKNCFTEQVQLSENEKTLNGDGWIQNSFPGSVVETNVKTMYVSCFQSSFVEKIPLEISIIHAGKKGFSEV